MDNGTVLYCLANAKHKTQLPAVQTGRSPEDAARVAAASKEAAWLETRISTMCGSQDLLARQLDDTAGNVEKKQARSWEELQEEQADADGVRQLLPWC